MKLLTMVAVLGMVMLGCSDLMLTPEELAAQAKQEAKQEAKRALAQRKAYTAKFLEAKRAVNPNLPIEERCKYITDLIEPPTYDCLNTGILCRQRRNDIQTTCEVMLEDEN